MLISLYLLWMLNRTIRDLNATMKQQCIGMSSVYVTTAEIINFLAGRDINHDMLKKAEENLDKCILPVLPLLAPTPAEVKNDKR